jgi:hypothetical protein
MATLYHTSPKDIDLTTLIGTEHLSKDPPWNDFNKKIIPYVGKKYDYFKKTKNDVDWTLYTGLMMKRAEVYIEFIQMYTPWIDIDLISEESIGEESHSLRFNLRSNFIRKRNYFINFIKDKGIYIQEDTKIPKEHLMLMK